MAFYEFKTTARFVLFRTNHLFNDVIKKKDVMIGKWLWDLECRQLHDKIMLKLWPKQRQNLSPPIASFVLRKFYSRGTPKVISAEVNDRKISYEEGCLLEVGVPRMRESLPVTLSLEFLDFKLEAGNDGMFYSIWDNEHTYDEEYSTQNSLSHMLKTMFSESIFTDIVISTKDGSTINAHRAVLSSVSPIFHAMFSNDYKEKETSTVAIDDMSTEACEAMIQFIYGQKGAYNLNSHKLEIIKAADKYQIADLRKACEDCFCEEVGATTVFKSLIISHRYNLQELQSTCMLYLMEMGMIFELQEDYHAFLLEADQELLVKVSKALLKAWEST